MESNRDEWWDQALCHSLVHDKEYLSQRELYKLFFPTRHSNGAATASAKRLCMNFCSVAEECRRHALETGEKHGVRGGLTANDRRRIRATVIQGYGELDEYLATA